eukprot:CAMPEP_0184497888 /NCGR_PEP_ID=MMETSP0113_2-20130426/37661_1 /TAXON_ID=91329 /ORGANISM="Norrisiella sphaerica, Strain BC52" /LENGTH=444 /DNA_ID=CAMNT_0026885181 /DNA_START=1 /DNA_END=1335 /DNA_ORIENTATION=-
MIVLTPMVSLLYFLGVPPVRSVLNTTILYYRALWYFTSANAKYHECPFLKGNKCIRARVHIASLASVFYLWDKQHYRHSTFQMDMQMNLRNLAIPGTGVPLSLFTRNYIATILFIVIANPIICLFGALRGANDQPSISQRFASLLLQPEDWFSLWRLNCGLAAMHYHRTRDVGYQLEDKWKFLQAAKLANIPVSPWLDEPLMVIKHCNEEGGLGFYRYKNVTAGGKWIIQPALQNEGIISKLLPSDAPLSTFRVLTASTKGLSAKDFEKTGSFAKKKEPFAKNKEPRKRRGESKSVKGYGTKTLTVVWRAGRSGASTDHESILFDVNPTTGTVGVGSSNKHWYQLGLIKPFTTPWTQNLKYYKHPDSGVTITNKVVNCIDSIVRIAETAHKTLVPGVPLVGWDVAVTNKGILLLEGNFSCNFFMGTVDYDWYYAFCDAHYRRLW